MHWLFEKHVQWCAEQNIVAPNLIQDLASWHPKFPLEKYRISDMTDVKPLITEAKKFFDVTEQQLDKPKDRTSLLERIREREKKKNEEIMRHANMKTENIFSESQILIIVDGVHFYFASLKCDVCL